MVRRLSEPVTAFRIADQRFDIRSGFGAALYGGRWNATGSEMLYACETFACAMLERLAHTNIGRIPASQVAVRMELPFGCRVTEFDEKELGDWLHEEWRTQELGTAWLRANESVALRVPSIVARPYEHNLLLNPRHDDFARVFWHAPTAIAWDDRLLSR